MAPERLDTLIMARLCVGRPNLASTRDSLYRFVDDGMTRGQWRRTFDAAVARLTDKGWLVDGQPSATGREGLAEALGIDALPSFRTWDAAVSQIFAPLAVGQRPEPSLRKKLKQPERLRAAILTEAHELPLDIPTLTRAIDALIWRELGVERDTPLTLHTLRRLMLHRALGTPERSDAKTQAAMAAAASVGASSRDARALRKALLLRWLRASAEPTETAPSDDLATFSATVLRIAGSNDVARWGADKSFIASLHEVARQQGASAVDLDAFKARLLDAQRAGHLRLARADLVGAMDPELVARSETRYLHSSFHFVIAPQETRA